MKILNNRGPKVNYCGTAWEKVRKTFLKWEQQENNNFGTN
jgi:hypothetical protein